MELSGGAMVLGNFRCRGALITLIILGQEASMLSVGAGGVF